MTNAVYVMFLKYFVSIDVNKTPWEMLSLCGGQLLIGSWLLER